MKIFQLTPLAKARIWFGKATPGFASAGSVCGRFEVDARAGLVSSQVTLEALVPRGGYVQYGLLGFAFDERTAMIPEVEVHHSRDNEMSWSESLAQQVDDVRLGLPFEYAGPVLVAAASFASHRFPPGRLETVESAHGYVGSSVEVFRRLTVGALSLLQSRSTTDEELSVLLKGILVD